ncbi:hypothetical protein C6H66_02450 [Photorhabdus hindustanensis]|uniref:Uncharacterized protein n=1 Tax=Photorhabdus hindustanensis TaxID=2918802 RepID=A0A2S8Q876_9GAMM|nr:hypothetical protein C6H66_02450 [Photorhabdus hindustanensis]
MVFKILSNGSYMSNEFSEKTIKYFSILYDPMAAVFGIALRRNLAIKGYTEYLQNTKYLFIILAIMNIGFYLLASNMSEFYFLAIVFFICLLGCFTKQHFASTEIYKIHHYFFIILNNLSTIF